jgi:hypothetical protein
MISKNNFKNKKMKVVVLFQYLGGIMYELKSLKEIVRFLDPF